MNERQKPDQRAARLLKEVRVREWDRARDSYQVYRERIRDTRMAWYVAHGQQPREDPQS